MPTLTYNPARTQQWVQRTNQAILAAAQAIAPALQQELVAHGPARKIRDEQDDDTRPHLVDVLAQADQTEVKDVGGAVTIGVGRRSVLDHHYASWRRLSTGKPYPTTVPLWMIVEYGGKPPSIIVPRGDGPKILFWLDPNGWVDTKFGRGQMTPSVPGGSYGPHPGAFSKNTPPHMGETRPGLIFHGQYSADRGLGMFRQTAFFAAEEVPRVIEQRLSGAGLISKGRGHVRI